LQLFSTVICSTIVRTGNMGGWLFALVAVMLTVVDDVPVGPLENVWIFFVPCVPTGKSKKSGTGVAAEGSLLVTIYLHCGTTPIALDMVQFA
jgi:hypothetical protein